MTSSDVPAAKVIVCADCQQEFTVVYKVSTARYCVPCRRRRRNSHGISVYGKKPHRDRELPLAAVDRVLDVVLANEIAMPWEKL